MINKKTKQKKNVINSLKAKSHRIKQMLVWFAFEGNVNRFLKWKQTLKNTDSEFSQIRAPPCGLWAILPCLC